VLGAVRFDGYRRRQPGGREPVRKSLAQHQMAAHLVVQRSPRGMVDAVLRFSQSPAYVEADDVLLGWILRSSSPTTVSKLFSALQAPDNEFTFATRRVISAYTLVLRDAAGGVMGVVETRQNGVPQMAGERDIALLVFERPLCSTCCVKNFQGNVKDGGET
jgi:hypothetical protein